MTDGILQKTRVKLVLDVLYLLVFVALVTVLIVWIGTMVFDDSPFNPQRLWRVFAQLLLGAWAIALVELDLMFRRRKRLEGLLLEQRNYLVNANLAPDKDYLSFTEEVLGKSPLRKFSAQVLGISLVSIVFIGFVNSQPLDGWVRAVIVVSIISLLFVPVFFVAGVVETSLNRSNFKILEDV